MYDYVGHLKIFGFEWNLNALCFKFEIKIDSEKIKKKIFLLKNTRKNISTDQQRVWNMLPNWQFNNSANDNSRIPFLFVYLYDEKKIKDFFNISNSYDFTTLTTIRKNLFLIELTKKHNKYPVIKGLDFFFLQQKNFMQQCKQLTI